MDSPTPQTESPYELTRRLENLATLGTVVAVRTQSPPRCRVQVGDNTTDWLPWLALRAGGADGGRSWWPPVAGEQCMVISPGGDLAAGVVLLGLYSDAMAAGSDKPLCQRTDWSPNDFWQWLEGTLQMRCKTAIELTVDGKTHVAMDASSIRLRTPQTSITMQGSTVQISGGGATLSIGPGQVTSNVDIVAMGISLTQHKHTGVSPGPVLTGGPQ